MIMHRATFKRLLAAVALLAVAVVAQDAVEELTALMWSGIRASGGS